MTVQAAPALVAPRPHAGRQAARTLSARVVLTIVIALLAVAASLAIALGNQSWFDALNGVIGVTDAVPRALLFSSWLGLIGGAIVVWRRRSFGLRTGDIRREWRLVTVVIVIAAAATFAVLRVVGATPYSDASLVVEVGVVPVTEELVFRSVLLTCLLVLMRRLHPAAIALALAIVVDGLAFGVAHLANLTAQPTAFVIGQAVFATVLGTTCAWVMARTRSVYPAMLLHGVVNAVVVLGS